MAAETESEGAGAIEHEKPDVQPAGRLREPVGRQASSGHGDQCLQEDAGGGGTEVHNINCGNHTAAGLGCVATPGSACLVLSLLLFVNLK